MGEGGELRKRREACTGQLLALEFSLSVSMHYKKAGKRGLRKFGYW